MNEYAKQLFAAREQIRLRDIEISTLKKQKSHSSSDGAALCNLRENVRTKEHENSELQDQIMAKNARIKQLEEMLEATQRTSLNSSHIDKPATETPRLRGVEVLTEVESEEDDDFRADMKTPTAYF